METQIDLPSGQAAVEIKQCSVESCAELAVAPLGECSLCMEHFAGNSMRELESRGQEVRNHPSNAEATDSFKKFLANCATQVKELLESENTSQKPGKERLLDILLLISQLNQRLRRSPRTTASVPLWLRREDPGQTWEEETRTSSISQHGAGLICRHRVEPGRTLFLCRKDRGGRARARVVYSHFDSGGDRQIGVEILDRLDFWDARELACTTEAPTNSTSASPSQEALQTATILADLEVQIAGQTAQYKQISLQLVSQGKETRISGTIPATLADFKIDPASLPGPSANKEAPVRIQVAWRSDK
jgi:PilZ domain